MKISTKKTVSKFAGRSSSQNNVSGLNNWGGLTNNEQKNTSKGFGGKTPDIYACDTSNEQPTKSSNAKFKSNSGAIDYSRGGDRSGNENPKGWKQ